MGVTGLEAFIRSKYKPETKKLSSFVDKVIGIDGTGFYFFTYQQSGLNYLYGGEYTRYRDYLRRLLKNISENAKLVFIFDGCDPTEKLGTSKSRRIQDLIRKKGIFEGDSSFSLPPILPENFFNFVKNDELKNVECRKASFEADEELGFLDCDAILTNDSDFFVFQGKYSQVLYFKECTEDDILVDVFDLEKVYNTIGVPKKQMPVFGCLIGNDYITKNEWRKFHELIGVRVKRNKITGEKQYIYEPMAKFIKGREDDAIINEISHFLCEESREIIKDVLLKYKEDSTQSNRKKLEEFIPPSLITIFGGLDNFLEKNEKVMGRGLMKMCTKRAVWAPMLEKLQFNQNYSYADWAELRRNMYLFLHFFSNENVEQVDIVEFLPKRSKNKRYRDMKDIKSTLSIEEYKDFKFPKFKKDESFAMDCILKIWGCTHLKTIPLDNEWLPVLCILHQLKTGKANLKEDEIRMIIRSIINHDYVVDEIDDDEKIDKKVCRIASLYLCGVIHFLITNAMFDQPLETDLLYHFSGENMCIWKDHDESEEEKKIIDLLFGEKLPMKKKKKKSKEIKSANIFDLLSEVNDD